ncbi:MAG: aldo/keto reductase [Chloroflexi bacterium]|nr:aldo/keto reductase [Chloroflexota bacterium]
MLQGLESARLGRVDFAASRIGFGGAPSGLTNYLDPFSPVDTAQREKVQAAIGRAVEVGINYFDTAAAYGTGESEKIFGEGLAAAGIAGKRDDLYIATKVSHNEPDPRASIECSLKNLQLDVIDLVQVHGTTYTPVAREQTLRIDGTLEVLEQARDEGLIRHIGFTTEDQNSPVYEFIASGRFDVMQTCYNLMFQHTYEPTRPFGSIYEADKAGMGVVTMRSLTAGVFQRWMKAVQPSNDFDYSSALLQFVLANNLIDVALVGMRTPEEVDKNVAILNDTAGRFDLNDLHDKFV